MKRLAKGFYMALGMFWAVPLPVQIWDDKSMSLMMSFFPVVGGLIGALWWGTAELLAFGGVHIILVAAVLAVFPFFLTGFLHLDGYMDTSDAVLSRRPLEDKLRILKDPHAGAFAVIMAAVLFMMQFAALYVIVETGEYFVILVIITVVSRCAAAMSIYCLKPMEQSGYATMFKQNTGVPHKIFIIILTGIALALAFFLAGIYGIIVSAAVIAGYIGAMAYAYRDFKGTSGDLTGYSLVIGELCGLVALAVVGGI